MNKKDLRIGNYVYWKNVIEPRTHFLIEEINDLKYVYCFEPITLNAEWLEKFGFKKNNMYWIDDTNIGFTFHKNGNIEWNQPKHIKYVHELQNLYFALTGKELAKV